MRWDNDITANYLFLKQKKSSTRSAAKYFYQIYGKELLRVNHLK